MCFSTNSLRRPSLVPNAGGVRVVYLAAAGKPLRTSAYQRFPRPGVVIGDQLATDGILARRLGYAFIQIDQPAGVPAGPRLMAAAGQLVRPLLFTQPRRPAPPPKGEDVASMSAEGRLRSWFRRRVRGVTT